MVDPLQFKREFPLFQQAENRALVYLDNAATTQRPAQVIDAIGDFYRHHNANAHRASHRLARAATDMLESCRVEAARFLGAAHAREIVFCRGATEALNLLAYSLCSGLQPGDEIILSEAEHHANLVPWQLAAQRHSLVLRFLPLLDGAPDMSALSALLTPRTRLLSVTAASNALGAVTDFSGVAALLAARGIPWIVDAAQLAAHARLDVRRLGCDFLVCSAHKFYGPTGIGLLYGKAERLAALPPWQSGGEMIQEVQLQHSVFAEAPQRFETGTAPLAAIAGLRSCLAFLNQWDRTEIHAHELALNHYLHERLARIAGLRLLSQPHNNLGIANFLVQPDAYLHTTDLALWLDQQDIAVRVGRHCAQPLMDSVAGAPSLRASLAGYNTEADVERLVHCIEDALRQPRMTGSATVESQSAVDTLRQLQGWQARYRVLMQWGSALAPQPNLQTAELLVRGCESATWIAHTQVAGKHYFQIDSEARVVRGLAVLLLSLIDGQDAAALRALDIDAQFDELGLVRHLSASRVNGFRALVDRAFQLAGVTRE